LKEKDSTPSTKPNEKDGASKGDNSNGDEKEPAEYGGFWTTRPKLTGDWLGLRGDLRDCGITFDISSTQFFQGLTTGGFPREIRLFETGLQSQWQYGGRLDYLVNVDGQKAGLWQGLSIDLHAETIYGNSVNSLTGALVPVSLGQAVPVPSGTVTALTGVTFVQGLSESFEVFGGKFNTLDSFKQPFTGGGHGVDGFMNAAFLFNPVLALTIPYSTFGVGAAVLKDKEIVLSLEVLDTNNTPTVSGFDTFFDNGMTVVVTVNLPTKFLGSPGHQGFTACYSSGSYGSADVATILDPLRGLVMRPGTTRGSWALAYAFDQQLAAAAADPKRGWGVFGNAGLSDGHPNPVRWTANIGLGGSSPLAERKLDSFGVGYFYVGVSDGFKQLGLPSPLRDEQGVECFYNIGLTPWCHLTADLQAIVPTSPGAEASLLFGLRAKIDF
jgi:porin